MKTKDDIIIKTKEDIIRTFIIAFIIALAFIFFIVYTIYIVPSTSNPTKTFYLASNLFPLKAYGYVGGIRFPRYAFYGTLQPNGTECISSIAVYSFNYTTQKASIMPQTIITDPKQVAKIYYDYAALGTIFVNSSKSSAYIVIPKNYTLLCPDVVNAKK